MPIFYNISTLTDDPAGIKMIENPTKTLKCVLFPRTCLSEFNKLTESNQAGVYILYNTIDRNEQPHIYIGQTGYNITSRISNHNRTKDFWNQALVFVEKGDFLNLNSAHAKIIESLLISEAEKCGAVVMDNSTGSRAPRVQKSDMLAAETWTEEVITITKILGLAFFVPQNNEKQIIEKPIAASVAESKKAEKTIVVPDGVYTLNVKTKVGVPVRAIMEVRGDSYIVKTGSVVNKTTHPDRISPFAVGQREKAIDENCRLTMDVECNSPSIASMVVLGYSSNGWRDWKNEAGQQIDIYRNTETE